MGDLLHLPATESLHQVPIEIGQRYPDAPHDPSTTGWLKDLTFDPVLALLSFSLAADSFETAYRIRLSSAEVDWDPGLDGFPGFHRHFTPDPLTPWGLSQAAGLERRGPASELLRRAWSVIPAAHVAVTCRFPILDWLVLAHLQQCPASVQLADKEPGLFAMVSYAQASEDLSHAWGGDPTVLPKRSKAELTTLLAAPMGDLLSRLGFPAEPWVLDLLRALKPQEISVWDLSRIARLLIGEGFQVPRTVVHERLRSVPGAQPFARLLLEAHLDGESVGIALVHSVSTHEDVRICADGVARDGKQALGEVNAWLHRHRVDLGQLHDLDCLWRQYERMRAGLTPMDDRGCLYLPRREELFLDDDT